MATTVFNKTALANGTSTLNVRADALNQSSDLAQAGVVFNDAIRISTGLFNLSGSGNANPFLGSYTTDIHAVQNDIAAMLATPAGVTLGGQAFTLNTTDTAVLTNIQAQLGTLLTAAPQTTNAATLTAADQTLHAVQNEILQEINNDPHIAAALNNVTFMAATGANDVAFQNTPAGADDPAALAAATAGNSLKAVGEVFNAAATVAAGGISTANLAEITNDFTAVQQGLTKILGNATMLAQIEAGETANAAALTTVHLQTVLNQINLQLNKYDNAETTGSATALRGTSDNVLDIIDIVQGDANLNVAAGGNGAAGHAGGFAEMPGGLIGTVTKFQDNQAQTNFWASFLAEANTINAHLTGIANGTQTASAALVTQIQNYQNFGAAFDAAQGAVFQGRFDNELNNGTLQADTAASVKGLTGILNGDTGAALAADKAMLVAAGSGFAADAMDVSGNNIAIGGATYVGTATTVATATSVNGLAQGSIPVTATPNIANGTGGTVGSGTTGGGGGGGVPTTLFNKTALANGTSNLIVRADALNHSTDLVQAGVVFNDAVRISTGLFNLSGSGNAIPFLGEYTADIHAVQNDIAAMLATPAGVTLGGQAFTLNTTDTAVLTNIQGQLGTLLTAAPQTTNAATLTAADQTLHAVQNEILQEINNDPHIAAALNNVQFLANTGANDVAFQNTPAGADDPAALAAATAGTSLKAVGEVFNAAATVAAGGINAANLGEITNDFTAVQQGLTKILGNATMLAQIEAGETANAAALTTVHLQTVLNQINLQLTKYDGAEATGSATALRGTSDNVLDIIDIVQGDANLNVAAGGNGAAGHAGGFAEMPGGLTGTVQKFQDNQAQTNFWASFLAEANTINAHLTGIANGTQTASAALVTQIQNYQNFGASFDAAQGAVFQGRFDNELNNGTLQADTAASVKGLTGILNGDTGAALAADKAMLVAAGSGFAADAMDVSGNNIAITGATYVGTATTVATATSVNGLAQGSIPVTATPNIANGTGGTATTTTTTSGADDKAAANNPAAPAADPNHAHDAAAAAAATTLFNKTALANGTSNLIVRADALNHSTDLVQAGVVFNDAIRISTGLFNLSGSGNANPFLGSYTTDIHAVQNDIAAMLATPAGVTLGGQAFTLNTTDTAVLTNIQGQLGTLLAAAPQTTNAATLTAADQTLHAVQNEILQEINNDPHIAAALNNVQFLANTGANDVAFQNVPAGADDPAALAAATAGNSLKAVGEVFNAAATVAAGGISSANLGQITNDFTAVQQGLTNILNNHTMLAQIEAGETANAAALTTVHLQTMLNQINLQLTKYDGAEANGSATALRGTSDNVLDIIDIVQGDANLNMAAGGNGAAGHAGGFAEMPGGLTGTVTKFQDNQAQTNFWASFLAEANTINAHLTAIAGGGEQASAALVTQIQNYQQFGANFDAAQGAVFQGRFDNELNNGTLEADTAASIKGLMGILNGDTGAALAADHAMLVAAGQGFAADAMDVSGNNIAIGGATYVGTATTVATATSVNGLAQGTIPVTATPNIANGTGGTVTSTTTTSGPDDKPGAPPACGHGHDDAPAPAAQAPAPAPASVEIHMLTPMEAFHQHFDHMWG
jgi:hypothetical protein